MRALSPFGFSTAQILGVGEAGPVADVVLLGLQPLQNLGKDLRVIVVDLQGVRQIEAHVGPGAAIGAADADHQVVSRAEPALPAVLGEGLVEPRQSFVQNIHRAEAVGQLLDQLPDLVVLGHHPGALLPLGNGAGHVADQGQGAAQVVAGAVLLHDLGQLPDGLLPAGVEHPAQAGPQHPVDLGVQIIQAVCDLKH